LLVCVSLWRVACDFVTSWLIQCDDLTMWRVDCDELTIRQLDRVTSWSCDQLTGSPFLHARILANAHTVGIVFSSGKGYHMLGATNCLHDRCLGNLSWTFGQRNGYSSVMTEPIKSFLEFRP